MSYIYGRINLNGESVSADIFNLMTLQLQPYMLPEKVERIERNFAFGFACTHKRNEVDSNPYFDKSTGTYVLFEGILDNKKELISMLKGNNKSDLGEKLSDCRLILQLYYQFHHKFVDKLLGDFAFLIYESKTKKILAARDPAGKRTLYYNFDGNTFTFATTINPITAVIYDNLYPTINQQYMAEFIALSDIRHEMTPGITIYESIFYLLPGAYLTIENKRLIEKRYWNPEKIKSKIHFSRKRVISDLKKTFDEAVRCRIETEGNVGLLLSGGLDSTAIACTAAPMLAEKGLLLHTFTSIPGNDYKNWVHPSRIVDETSSIEMLKEQITNIESHYESVEAYNSFNVLDKLLMGFEQPYKFIENSYWLYGLTEKARENGCHILLNGTFGNANISFGSIESHLHERLIRADIFGAIKDSLDFCRVHKAGKKKFIKDLIKILKQGKLDYQNGLLISPLLNNIFVEKYDINTKISRLGYDHKTQLNFKKHQKLFHDVTLLHHLAAAEVKMGLLHGITDRDPTRDKRVMESMLQLPYRYYFYKGYDRGLVRSLFEGVMPEKTRTNIFTRGLQGADWMERISKFWPQIHEELTNMLIHNEGIIQYYNIKELSELIKGNVEIKYTFEGSKAMRDLFVAYAIGKFYNKQTKEH